MLYVYIGDNIEKKKEALTKLLKNHTECEIFYIKDTYIFSKKKDIKVSFIPIDKENKISLKGFKFDLSEKPVKRMRI